MFNKLLLHKICFILIKKEINEESNKICLNGNVGDLLENVSSVLDNYVID